MISQNRKTITAFACWNNRIAPVFDTARQIYVVESVARSLCSESHQVLWEDVPVQKAMKLAELGVEILVCGAISRPVYGLVVAYGIQIIPFIAGEVHEIVQAWLSGTLEQDIYAMPGCCGRRSWRFQQRNMNTLEVNRMSRRGRGMGAGGGKGQGQGQGGQRGGRMGGGMMGGSTGVCVCPQCGQQIPHERGTPCVDRPCPKCGTSMVRR